MPAYRFRFYEELNDFLPREKRKTRFVHRVNKISSVKDIIKALGVPLMEVDLILVNGKSVGFSYLPAENDEISVYPMFESLDISTETQIPSRPLRRTRFILDVHLGKLARVLRMLGMDSLHKKTLSETELIKIMQHERRIILTRNKNLLQRKAITHGYFLRSELPANQAVEIIRRFDLFKNIRPFTRCLDCNEKLFKVDKQENLKRLPPKVREDFDTFNQCPACEKVYWEGSHWDAMKRRIEQLKREAESKTV